MPNVIVISGANGAGKSTLAPHLLRDAFNILDYVNADTIAQGLSAFAPEKFAIAAGRVMLNHIKLLAMQGNDFAFETTLSSKFYATWLQKLQANGYEFHLIFLYLHSSELAVERVRERVRMGGHNIPEDVIRRRYTKGLQNFFKIYQPIADSWRVYDVSNDKPIDIAFGDKIGVRIFESRLWKQIQNKT